MSTKTKKKPKKPQTIKSQLLGAVAALKDLRSEYRSTISLSLERRQRISELEQELERVKRQLENARSEIESRNEAANEQKPPAEPDPWRIEELIKEWIPVLNRLHVSVDMHRSDPYVNFIKGPFNTAIHKRHIVHYGLQVVIDMFLKVPGEGAVVNRIDNEEGWVHPEAQAGEKERALEQAGEILARSGLIPGTNVTVKVGDPDA